MNRKKKRKTDLRMKEKRIENIMCSIMNLLNGFANVRAELMQVARECQDNEGSSRCWKSV